MNVAPMPIKPKQVEHEHEGQKFICRYDPKASTDKCWVWQVKYVETFHFVGSSPTLPIALREARRKIHSLNQCQIRVDENE